MNDKSDKLAVLDRRGFLQALGISGVATLAACERLPARKAMPYLTAPEEITPGVPVRYASTCTGCAAACGLMVTVRDGRPIKLEGRADHPLSAGGLCALGQAEIRGLYDAGRLTAPSIGGAAASWQDVDRQVRTVLADVRSGGGGVRVLASTVASPTARATIDAFLAPFGGKLVEHDPSPASQAGVVAAYEAIDGRRAIPALDIEAADVLVVLGADLFGAGPDPVAHAASYAARRRAAAQRGALRHIQIEGSLSITGAGADVRWRATAAERTGAALWLLKSIAQRTGGNDVLSALSGAGVPDAPPLGDRLARLADELHGKRGKSLVVSGSQDVAEQAAVAQINRLLGNEGKTLDLERASHVGGGTAADLDELRGELEAGKVSALVVVGLDPVEQLPDGDRWATWLSKLRASVAITDRPTATAAACGIVAAAHHGLESWGDYAPRADVLTLAQPTIRPLYDTRHPFENFLHWSGAAVTDYRAHLEASWKRTVYPHVMHPAGFADFWHKSVAAGRPAAPFAPSVAGPTAAPTGLARALASTAPAADKLEVELIGQVGVRDGTRAFNPWLRELPDPITRVSWLPTVAVAPARARQLGVTDGDLLSIAAGTGTVQMPVRVVRGQHPDVLGVPVGYGRTDGDRGQPRNAYRLDGRAAKASATGKRTDLPLAQWHDSTEGRPIVHQVTRHDEKVPPGHHVEPHTLWKKRPLSSPHWHMTINLDACTGCSACVVACQAENNIPVVGPEEVHNRRDLYWLRMDRYYVGDEDDPEVVFEPMLCAQCDNAPCETVCPVAATVHSQDGLNQQAYNRCVGTRYCANNCPYKVRRFNWFDYDHGEPVERLVLNPDVVVRSRGVMEKCTFCVQRIQLARIEARNRGDEGVPQVRTACQQSCPADAIHFGDVTNPNSDVVADMSSPRSFQVLSEVGTEPSITYLARVRSRNS